MLLLTQYPNPNKSKCTKSLIMLSTPCFKAVNTTNNGDRFTTPPLKHTHTHYDLKMP